MTTSDTLGITIPTEGELDSALGVMGCAEADKGVVFGSAKILSRYKLAQGIMRPLDSCSRAVSCLALREIGRSEHSVLFDREISRIHGKCHNCGACQCHPGYEDHKAMVGERREDPYDIYSKPDPDGHA